MVTIWLQSGFKCDLQIKRELSYNLTLFLSLSVFVFSCLLLRLSLIPPCPLSQLIGVPAGCPLLIKSFNRQSIKTYFPPPKARIHILIQFVTMETAREEQLGGDLMELKIVSTNYIRDPGKKTCILSSMVMRMEKESRELIVDFLLTYIWFEFVQLYLP